MFRKSFLPVVRELVHAYQAFESFSSAHIREFGLTPCQFDIVATLGNTPGMSFKRLGEKTLITKGTLTGVVDRLEANGLVRRVAAPNDRRSQIVQLTDKGEALFDKVFPEHLDYVGQVFDLLPQEEMDRIEATLLHIGHIFRNAKIDKAAVTAAEA
jgi:DNA-binding MarR family transcriptional regulator